MNKSRIRSRSIAKCRYKFTSAVCRSKTKFYYNTDIQWCEQGNKVLLTIDKAFDTVTCSSKEHAKTHFIRELTTVAATYIQAIGQDCYID